jgi:hypothetical protein
VTAWRTSLSPPSGKVNRDSDSDSKYVILRIAPGTVCDMLSTTMATQTLTVTNTDRSPLVVWIYDLNLPGAPSQQVVSNANGVPLAYNVPLPVQLTEDANHNVSYYWSAEEIAVQHVRHDTGIFPPPAAAAAAATASSLSISLTGTGKPLPYMFRRYP